jgi:hypothetical protein
MVFRGIFIDGLKIGFFEFPNLVILGGFGNSSIFLDNLFTSLQE